MALLGDLRRAFYQTTDGVRVLSRATADLLSRFHWGLVVNILASNCVRMVRPSLLPYIRLYAPLSIHLVQKAHSARTLMVMAITISRLTLLGYLPRKINHIASLMAPQIVVNLLISQYLRLPPFEKFARAALRVKNSASLLLIMEFIFRQFRMPLGGRIGQTLNCERRRMSVLTFVPGRGYFNGLSV